MLAITTKTQKTFFNFLFCKKSFYFDTYSTSSRLNHSPALALLSLFLVSISPFSPFSLYLIISFVITHAHSHVPISLSLYLSISPVFLLSLSAFSFSLSCTFFSLFSLLLICTHTPLHSLSLSLSLSQAHIKKKERVGTSLGARGNAKKGLLTLHSHNPCKFSP
jgi:hypothetical protein